MGRARVSRTGSKRYGGAAPRAGAPRRVRAAARPARTLRADVRGEAVTRTAHILVVDDDPDIGEFVTLALSDLGYEVVTAPHGRAALQAVAERPRA